MQTEKEKDIDTTIDRLLNNLSLFYGSARATRGKPREIVSDVAELGLEFEKLPFKIQPILDFKPRDPFVADMM